MLNGTGLSHETDRSTYLETLVVRKAKTRAQRATVEWEARVVEGEVLFQSVDQRTLKQLLGDQFEELRDLRSVGRAGVRAQGRHAPQAKRADIIDLT